MTESSEFKHVFEKTKWSDRFYLFLQEVFHLYPEDKFHHLIAENSAHGSDEKTYKDVQHKLKEIKPFLSEITYALPALKKQKKEMTSQVIKILGNKKSINGYLEIGSTGRYVSDLRKKLRVKDPIYLLNDVSPTNTIADIMERGQLKKIGTFFQLDYSPIPDSIPNNSIEIVTCMIGLHHCPVEKLDAFVLSIHRILAPGGLFIIRDHDVTTPEMATFVSLVHTVFNLGLNESWEKNQQEFRSFHSVDEWIEIIKKSGLQPLEFRILQNRDPSLNTLLAFQKE